MAELVLSMMPPNFGNSPSLLKKVDKTLQIDLPKDVRLAEAQTDTGNVFLLQEVPGSEGLFSKDPVTPGSTKNHQSTTQKPKPRPKPKPKPKNLEPAAPVLKENELEAEHPP
ncbi:hypothetical protein CPC08DRAFT_729840 [Agrocybe pediades]|nr:hypothetical protein CPC08DRAFT_729840 [Agrocybe pediades]